MMGKKMKSKILIFGFCLICFLVQGCFRSLRYDRIEPYSKEEETISLSRIGIQQESATGSAMVLIANFTTTTTYRLGYKSKFTMTGYLFDRQDTQAIEINPSQTWIAWGRREDGLIRIMVEGPNPYLGLDIFEDGSIPDETIKRLSSGERKFKPPDKNLFEKISVPKETGRMSGFKAELIYNGISKNTIKIAYREFMNELARPAFYQELYYDLDISNIIQFKTFKIEVLHADNSLIRFIILDDGGLPWVPKR